MRKRGSLGGNKGERIGGVDNPKEQEAIWNVPNTLTLIRVLLTFVIVYMVFAGFPVLITLIVFGIAAVTDFLDGQIARRFNKTTKFGAKFDMIADRFLMVGVALAFIIQFSISGSFTRYENLQIYMIMSREIITLPFAVMAIMMQSKIPKARFIGKLTTFLQGFAFPSIILSTEYSFFGMFSLYLALITCIVGILSALTYVQDSFIIAKEANE